VTCDRARDLLWASEHIGDDDRGELAEHLSSCPDCRIAAETIDLARQALAADTARAPSRSLQQALLAVPKTERRRSVLVPLALPFAALLCVLSSTVLWTTLPRLSDGRSASGPSSADRDRPHEGTTSAVAPPATAGAPDSPTLAAAAEQERGAGIEQRDATGTAPYRQAVPATQLAFGPTSTAVAPGIVPPDDRRSQSPVRPPAGPVVATTPPTGTSPALDPAPYRTATQSREAAPTAAKAETAAPPSVTPVATPSDGGRGPVPSPTPAEGATPTVVRPPAPPDTPPAPGGGTPSPLPIPSPGAPQPSMPPPQPSMPAPLPSQTQQIAPTNPALPQPPPTEAPGGSVTATDTVTPTVTATSTPSALRLGAPRTTTRGKLPGVARRLHRASEPTVAHERRPACVPHGPADPSPSRPMRAVGLDVVRRGLRAPGTPLHVTARLPQT